jgi:hypothetical protein
MTRLKADSVLQTLLGGAGRIMHSLELFTPKSPGVYYKSIANTRGRIFSDGAKTSEEMYQFKVFSDSTEDVLYRLRVLLDDYRFPDQADTGSIVSCWDSDGPDLYDDSMERAVKTCQFRVTMVPKAAAAV